MFNLSLPGGVYLQDLPQDVYGAPLPRQKPYTFHASQFHASVTSPIALAVLREHVLVSCSCVRLFGDTTLLVHRGGFSDVSEANLDR